MSELDELLARGERLSPAVSAANGLVVVDRPGVSRELMSIPAAIAVAHRLLDAAAKANGQALLEAAFQRRKRS